MDKKLTFCELVTRAGMVGRSILLKTELVHVSLVFMLGVYYSQLV